MTQIKVDSVVNAAGSGKPDFSDGITVAGGAISSLNLCQYTSSGTEPSSPKNGAIWWDTVNGKYKVYLNGEFKEIELGGSGAAATWYGDKALIFGGLDSSSAKLNSIEKFTIQNSSTTASDFGDLTVAKAFNTGTSSGTRGVIIGGYGASQTNTIEYVTIATDGNATDYGDLTQARYGVAATTNGTLASAMGGWDDTTSRVNIIDYWTIDTGGTAADQGDLSAAVNYGAGIGNDTYGVMAGGYRASGEANQIEYFSWASLGSSTDTADLTVARTAIGACSNDTYGIWMGGGLSRTNIIDRITVSTQGNAADHGDLTNGTRNYLAAVGNADYAVSVGGVNASNVKTDHIEYVAFATSGNSTDIGDLVTGRQQLGACSGSAS